MDSVGCRRVASSRDKISRGKISRDCSVDCLVPTLTGWRVEGGGEQVRYNNTQPHNVRYSDTQHKPTILPRTYHHQNSNGWSRIKSHKSFISNHKLFPTEQHWSNLNTIVSSPAISIIKLTGNRRFFQFVKRSMTWTSKRTGHVNLCPIKSALIRSKITNRWLNESDKSICRLYQQHSCSGIVSIAARNRKIGNIKL